MKNVLLFIVLTIALSSCNTSKTLTTATKNFLNKHHFEATVKPNPVTGTTRFKASIDSLYDVSKIKGIARQADITFKIADAKVIVEGEAVGILDADKIAELYKSVISSISFWKK